MAHPSARLTPQGRRLLVDRVASGWTITKAARGRGHQPPDRLQVVAAGTAREGVPACVDRSSAVHHQARGPSGGPRRARSAPGGASCGSARTSWAGSRACARSTVYAFLRRQGLAGSTGSSPGRRSCATSASARASSSTSTPRCSGGSARAAATGSTAAGTSDRHRGIGWDRVHVAIDDHSRLAYARSCPTSHRPRRRASSSAPGASTRAMASRSSGSSPTTAAATGAGTSPRPATSSASATGSPGPTGPRPTARPSGSSGPCSPSGPTPGRSPTPPTGSAAAAAVPGLLQPPTTTLVACRPAADQPRAVNDLTGKNS